MYEDNPMHGRRVSGGAGGSAVAARDGAAVAARGAKPRVFVFNLADTAWYFQDTTAASGL